MAFSDWYAASWQAHASPANFNLRVLTFAASAPQTWTLLVSSGNYTPTSHCCPNPQVFQVGLNSWALQHSNADETFSPSWQNWPTAAKLAVATGTDGLNFTPLGLLDYSTSYDAIFGSTWFKDRAGVTHIIYPASPRGGGLGDTGSFQMFEIHPLSSDVTTWGTTSGWSTPVQLTGTGLPTSYQDPCIVDDGSNYYLFFGTANGCLKNATSAAAFPTSGWAAFKATFFDITGLSGGGDGPTMVLIGSTWWFFYEQTNGGGIKYTTQTSGAGDWRGTDTNAWSAIAAVNGGNTERTGSLFAIQNFATSGVSRTRMQVGM